MNMNREVIRSAANPNLELVAYSGHFATRHSHNTHYLDITRMKHEFTMAREAAITLAQCYASDKKVDTIVCLDGSEVIGAFLARHLSKDDSYSVNQNKNINVVTPEYNSNGQFIFRENLMPMISGKDVLILISTVNSGKTARCAVECVRYYGGRPRHIAAVFSKMGMVANTPVYSLFTPMDVPGYGSHSYKDCPLCAAGQKIDALANSYGLAKL
jgi:orotate phosphoribosyltransferase